MIQILNPEDSSPHAGSADKIPDSDRGSGACATLCKHIRYDNTAALPTSTATCRKGCKKMGVVAQGGSLSFSAHLCRESFHRILSVSDCFDSQVSRPANIIQSLLHDNIPRRSRTRSRQDRRDQMVVSPMARIPQRALVHIHDSCKARPNLGSRRSDSSGCPEVKGTGTRQGEPAEEG